MNIMTIDQFKDEIEDGKIFSVEFVKKNGDVRIMSARRGVSKGVKNDPGTNGSANRANLDAIHNVLTVYDVNKMVDGQETKGAFRRINIETIRSVSLHGQKYIMDVEKSILVSE